MPRLDQQFEWEQGQQVFMTVSYSYLMVYASIEASYLVPLVLLLGLHAQQKRAVKID